jgi:zinc protease
MNGTTNQDRTNYYEVVPKNALEMTLWLESDRMGHLLGAIDQAKLDEQRDVVKNEKRQGENQPYGKVFSTILENAYPAGHPYSWSVIGSMDDLNAATVDDVHEWFKHKYGAANATISLAGDIEPLAAKALVEKYFSAIPSGPPLTRQAKWIAKRQGKHVQEMHDKVPHARVYKIWNVPEWGSKEANDLSLASAVLSSGKKSRLYNRLVYKEQVAVDVSAFSFQSEIGGLFGIVATAHDQDKLEYIEQAIDEELTKFLQKGPTKKELARVKVAYSWY